MKVLNVAFLWHMHQPYYVDPVTGRLTLPWVRLHGIRGYFDMAATAAASEGVRVNFNLVPSLLEQIGLYASGKAVDTFLELSQRRPEDLTPEEKGFILKNFFMCHWETMIRPYPRFQQLYARRGMAFSMENLDSLLLKFTDEDIRDLQVWFNLTWFGFQAEGKHKIIRAMKRKGRDFAEEEKAEVLKLQLDLLGEIIPLYRRLQEEGKAELTTSPYFHPILPLLVDTDHAARALPGRALPFPAFRHPSDARDQIGRGIALHERLFGSRPAGMWPPEGSVSPEAVQIAREAGITWMATDEGILLRSLSTDRKWDVLYKPYLVGQGDQPMAMVFRDRTLSDLIGFNYSRSQAQDAVADFLRRLQEIRNYLQNVPGEALALVALDGENPWEYFRDGGEEFLATLYRRLASEPTVRMVKVGAFLAENPPSSWVGHIWTGSWIHENFDIWIGTEEENAAWHRLAEARDVLRQEEALATLPGPTLERMRRSILAAEASDWFWWYGDDFTSECAEEFDRLFRANLGEVYRLAGRELPTALLKTILRAKDMKLEREPRGLVAPVIDGAVTSFFEWYDAGCFNARTMQSAMYQSERLLKEVFVGYDHHRLFLRVDAAAGDFLRGLEGLVVSVHFIEPRTCWITIPVAPEGRSLTIRTEDGLTREMAEGLDSFRAGKILEMALPFRMLGMRPGQEARFYIHVLKGDMEIEKCPTHGYIHFRVPDEHFKNRLWFV